MSLYCNLQSLQLIIELVSWIAMSLSVSLRDWIPTHIFKIWYLETLVES